MFLKLPDCFVALNRNSEFFIYYFMRNRKIRNILLAALGLIFVGLGAVGVILPVLPTTPFILVAAWCFAASNKTIYEWLCKTRIFGQYIENYRTRRGISLSLKLSSIAFLWAGLIISMVMLGSFWFYIVLGAVGLGVTIHLLLIKTRKN